VTDRDDPSDDPPPLLGSWRNLYLVVLGNLALTVVLLALFAAVTS
jgi:hypothetical protein